MRAARAIKVGDLGTSSDSIRPGSEVSSREESSIGYTINEYEKRLYDTVCQNHIDRIEIEHRKWKDIKRRAEELHKHDWNSERTMYNETFTRRDIDLFDRPAPYVPREVRKDLIGLCDERINRLEIEREY